MDQEQNRELVTVADIFKKEKSSIFNKTTLRHFLILAGVILCLLIFGGVKYKLELSQIDDFKQMYQTADKEYNSLTQLYVRGFEFMHVPPISYILFNSRVSLLETVGRQSLGNQIGFYARPFASGSGYINLGFILFVSLTVASAIIGAGTEHTDYEKRFSIYVKLTLTRYLMALSWFVGVFALMFGLLMVFGWGLITALEIKMVLLYFLYLSLMGFSFFILGALLKKLPFVSFALFLIVLFLPYMIGSFIDEANVEARSLFDINREVIKIFGETDAKYKAVTGREADYFIVNLDTKYWIYMIKEGYPAIKKIEQATQESLIEQSKKNSFAAMFYPPLYARFLEHQASTDGHRARADFMKHMIDVTYGHLFPYFVENAPKPNKDIKDPIRDENIYYSKARIAGNYPYALVINALFGLFLLGIGYIRFRKGSQG